MAPSTGRQQKRIKRCNTSMKSAGSLPQKRSATASTTRQQQKRKAPAYEHEESPVSKRPRYDCNGTYYFSNDQTGTTSTQTGPLPNSSGPAPSTTPCSFLSLPRELRDEIYKHVVHSSGVRAVILKNQTLTTISRLAGTNNQIRKEFLNAVLFHAPVIHTTARNHNFAPIVTFLNRLSDTQLRKFAAAATPNSAPSANTRSRKIIITLTYSHTKMSTRPQLKRWLDRFDDPNRRGAEVRFEYRLDRDSWQYGGYKQRVTERASAGVRSREEAKKMIIATREGRSKI